MSQPLGTVTFMFTDVEDSTRLWESHPSEMGTALARHDEILRTTVVEHHGHVFTTAGDSFAVAFARAHDAVNAAVEIQRRLADEPWPAQTPIRVRMGLHTGEAQERDGDYFGSAVNRAARVMSLASGEQVLLTTATHDVVSDADLGELGFLDLGNHRLKGLTKPEKLYQLTGPGPHREFLPISSGVAPEGNLPAPIDTLIGRERDVDIVRELVSSQRLVTIVGVGGIGKTTLALEAARRIADHYPDGVWLCELAEIGSADAIPAAIGQTIGCRQHPGLTMTQSIAEFCRQRQILLVLDNCEHVLPVVVELVETVLALGPDVSVLATSREALGSRREQAYPLSSLEFRQPDSPSIELFVRRTRQLNPSTVFERDQMTAVAAICERLDGMPLAIELAAARTRTMSPIDIEAHLDDAFRLLRGGRQSIERHRTLQAAIDWSYASLSSVEATVFEMLSVFAGSWDLDAAASLGRSLDLDEFDVIDRIDDLVAKSLVTVSPGRDGRTWYRLLEPVRQYAEDALAASGRAPGVRSAHLEHYLSWAREWTGHLPGPGPEWKNALLDRFANLRAAISWGLETRDAESTTELLRHLRTPRYLFQLNEIGHWAEQGLDILDIEQLDDGPAMVEAAALTRWQQADMEAFHRLSNRLMSLPNRDPTRDADGAAEALNNAFTGKIDQVRPVLDQIDRSNPLVDVNVAFGKWAFTGFKPLDNDELDHLNDLLVSTRSPLVATVLHNVNARAAFDGGRFEEAAAHCREACASADDIGANYFMHMSTSLLTSVAGITGRLSPDDAITVAASLRQQIDAGQQNEMWRVLHGLDVWLYRAGHRELAIATRTGFNKTLYASTWDQSGPLDHIAAARQLEKAAEETATEPVRSIFDLFRDALTILESLPEADDNHEPDPSSTV